MHRDVHTAALRAAAKVALSVVLVACGGSITSQGDNAPKGSGSGAASDDPNKAAGDEPASSIATNEPTPPTPTKDAAVDSAEPSDCITRLNAAFGTDGFATEDEKANAIKADLKECCREQVMSDDAVPTHRGSCCSTFWSSPAEEPQVYAACTPWGPPVPPAMNRGRGAGRSALLALLA